MADKEILLDSNSFIVSETDEKGIIRYANDEFCEISDYSLEELIGKPHNLLRHKDMPKEAFEDLWKTIQNGNIWKGFVKNRTKNDDYYWVYATVYPLTLSDGSKGYMSCRKVASRDEIKKAIKLYSTMK
ncbi:PAS sensor protein [Arcobacter nitrofigilis DSM 7299]|uniref:PAS sensor protein n=1 Tax=Arcobacter nitrofigilis (strain ATCC 33309 / DSM 7299 / CCUG 15893 / LMG 7604 / NCTC 12251 / CI) TaxID=572480 RepID=D5V7X5_ARCNC|nr:PAS sensor domain-containing protein [Arcobacter nitrofigilis]ADG94745.1 PAS sensor protein [Arcobacter nitrofigilis DSM 7299]